MSTSSIHIWTKEEAWWTPATERNVPINRKMHDFKIRRNWFRNRNQTTFSTFLMPRFPADRPWNMLTIGVFEGAQEIWLMQHVLRHPESRLVSVDPWEKTTKLDQDYMEQCRQNAIHNLSPWENQIQLIRGYSQEVLADAVAAGSICGIPAGQFDLIIIDGDHLEDPVYRDAVLSFDLVKRGGWLLFDDVRNTHYKPGHVAHGLERFLTDYEGQVEFAWAHRFCDCYTKR